MAEGPGRIVLLNGSPSAGKTTLADALQDILEEPYFYRSLDDFCDGYLDRYWLEDDGTLFRRVFRGYLVCLRELALLGHDIIAETVTTPSMLESYLTLFKDLPVLFVGLRCPLAVVQRRESERADRRIGPISNMDAPEFEAVHTHGTYDLSIDTSVTTPLDAARRIKGVLAAPPAPTAFELLRRVID